jgi:hypothetical protein
LANDILGLPREDVAEVIEKWESGFLYFAHCQMEVFSLLHHMHFSRSVGFIVLTLFQIDTYTEEEPYITLIHSLESHIMRLADPFLLVVYQNTKLGHAHFKQILHMCSLDPSPVLIN